MLKATILVIIGALASALANQHTLIAPSIDVVGILRKMAKFDSEPGYEDGVVHWVCQMLKQEGLTVELQLVQSHQQSGT